MLKKLLIAPVILLCVLTLSISAQAQTAAKKKVKKTVVTTTTEEVDENGKVIKKTEKVESETDDSAPEVKAEPKEEAPKNVWAGMPTPNEDWYTLWGLGFSKASYSGDLGDAYEKSADAPGIDRSSTMNLDILGFYWPLSGHKTMMGFIFNVAGDTAEDNVGGELSLYTYLMGFSVHHFFGRNIGDGWFVRGDAGLSWATVELSSSGITAEERSDMTLGFMFGGGYGFAIGEETRLLVGLYIRPLPEMKADGFTYGGDPVSKIKGTITNFSVGFLF